MASKVRQSTTSCSHRNRNCRARSRQQLGLTGPRRLSKTGDATAFRSWFSSAPKPETENQKVVGFALYQGPMIGTDHRLMAEARMRARAVARR